MINKITHTAVYVLNQDSAYDFYVNKLGFEVRTDAQMGKDARWLTVSPREQPDVELVLMPIVEAMMPDKETAEQLRQFVKRGIFGGPVLECEDIYMRLMKS